jgi:cytochrome c biogenesis protein CcmG/thiol:disulfide interchange protein DsbE
MPTKKTRERLLLLAVGVIALALLGIHPHISPPLPPELASAQRTPMADFTAPTLAGPPWRLSQHRGQVVLLNFWATWCPPCQEETPTLIKLSREMKNDGLEVIGVSMEGSSQNNIQPFVEAYHIPYPILLPRPFSPVTNLAQVLPTTYLIDRQGRIANATVGPLDESSLREELRRLLRESPGSAIRSSLNPIPLKPYPTKTLMDVTHGPLAGH